MIQNCFNSYDSHKYFNAIFFAPPKMLTSPKMLTLKIFGSHIFGWRSQFDWSWILLTTTFLLPWKMFKCLLPEILFKPKFVDHPKLLYPKSFWTKQIFDPPNFFDQIKYFYKNVSSTFCLNLKIVTQQNILTSISIWPGHFCYPSNFWPDALTFNVGDWKCSSS